MFPFHIPSRLEWLLGLAQRQMHGHRRSREAQRRQQAGCLLSCSMNLQVCPPHAFTGEGVMGAASSVHIAEDVTSCGDNFQHLDNPSLHLYAILRRAKY